MFATFTKRLLLATLALGSLLWTRAAHAELDVVATVPTLAAIAKEIGGSRVEVTSLSLPTQDPHFVDAKPSLALKLNKADLLLAVGLGLETGWLPTLQKGARNASILVGSRGYVDCSSFVRKLDVPHNVDRSAGDIHPGGSPHYLFSPEPIEHVAIGVAVRMSELDPEGTATYQRGLGSFLHDLHALRLAVAERMKSHAGAPIVTYHRSWSYLCDWLRLKPVAYIEPKPGIPPNPGHIVKVLRIAKAEKAKLILQESFYPNSTGRLIAAKTGATLVDVPGGVRFADGQTVAQYLAEVTDRVAKAL